MAAIPLTLVVIAAEIEPVLPSIMAWGMTGFDVVYLATHNVALGFIACLLAGLFAGWLNGYIIVQDRHPLAGSDHRHAILLGGRGDSDYHAQGLA